MSSIRSASSRTSTRTRAEIDHAAFEQVVHATRSGDHHVGGPRRARLCADRGAAVDGCDSKPLRRRQRAEVLRDLERELARRHEHEGRRAAARTVGALDERDAESECLARARRRLGQDVEAREGVGQDELLDCERRVDGARRERPDNGRADAERLEDLVMLCNSFESGSRCRNSNALRRRNEKPDLTATNRDRVAKVARARAMIAR